MSSVTLGPQAPQKRTYVVQQAGKDYSKSSIDAESADAAVTAFVERQNLKTVGEGIEVLVKETDDGTTYKVNFSYQLTIVEVKDGE